MSVPGDDHVDRVVHLDRLVHDLPDRLGARLERSGMREHHDRLDPAAPQLRHPAVDGVGDVGEAVGTPVLGQQPPLRVLGSHADEAHPDARALHHLVGGQEQLAAVALDRVRGDVRIARALPIRVGGECPRAVRALPPAYQPKHLGAALVELVVPDGPDVEPHHVRRLDGRLVVEVAREERGGADHVARVNGDRALGMRARRAREVRAEPGCAAHIRLGRLEVAVEVVDAEELELDGAGERRRRWLVGSGAQPQKRHKGGAGEGGRARKEVAAVGQSQHGGSRGASRFRLSSRRASRGDLLLVRDARATQPAICHRVMTEA